jgi:hypothetical protein
MKASIYRTSNIHWFKFGSSSRIDPIALGGVDLNLLPLSLKQANLNSAPFGAISRNKIREANLFHETS